MIKGVKTMSDQDRVTTTNPPQASEVKQETGAEQNQNSGDAQETKNSNEQSQPPANDSPTEGTGTGARAGEYS